MEKRTDVFGKKAMGLHKISGRIAKGEGSGDDVSGEKRGDGALAPSPLFDGRETGSCLVQGVDQMLDVDAHGMSGTRFVPLQQKFQD